MALSLLVHALVLIVFQQTRPQTPAIEADPAQPTITVWLRAPPPPPPTSAPPASAAPKSAAAPRAPRQASAKPRAARSAEVISVPQDERQTEAPSDAFVIAPPAPAADKPRFDLDAARSTARGMANEQPSKNLKPNEWLIAKRELDRPLETETKAAKAISQAKRRNCKDGLPGGLLGPILILFDKKDSGCKW
ncbi:hypothetical protein C7C56_021290 [Massilia glaciei]|uniref:Uncharacterized protein n=2 Tax=Massilia glaciei TaxID=1524097 RepID=A0A2U2HFQ2_9BURK|nr:hypothetical protein C7C56_021290 [Massilia glaciei]